MIHEEINPVIIALKSELQMTQRKLELAKRELEYLRESSNVPPITHWDDTDPIRLNEIPMDIRIPLIGSAEVSEEHPYEYRVIALTESDTKIKYGFYANMSEVDSYEAATQILMEIMLRASKDIARKFL